MKAAFTRTALAGSGAILGAVGSGLLIAPTIFLAMSEAIVERDPNLISEVSAPGGLLIVVGGFMMLSAVKLRLAIFGLLSGAVVYGTYGVSRLISMGLHGKPSDQLVVATWFELGVAILLLTLSLRARQARPTNRSISSYNEVTHDL